jgi:hypothetical protein
MNEAEARAEPVDPALAAAGWGVVEGSRIRREYPSATKPTSLHACADRLVTRNPRLESLYQRMLAALDELKNSLLHRASSGEL